jgi:hypothetical protein
VSSGNRDNLNWILDIALINSQNDLSFWEEARKVAITEKKTDIFDYGCLTLLKLGVYALKPRQAVKMPRILINTNFEARKDMSMVSLWYYRIQNTIFLINRLFSRSGLSTKLYYMTVIAKRFFHSNIKRI